MKRVPGLVLLVLGVIALSAQPARADLIGFYSLNGNANDLSGKGANATAVNNVSFVTGYEGQAGSFNGGSSLIRLPIDINPGVMPLLTMGAWVLPDNVNPVRGILSQDDGGFDRTLNIDYRGCGSASCYSAFTGSGVLAGTAAAANPSDWVFVAASYNGLTGAIKLYVDGDSFAATGMPRQGRTFIEIGHNPSFNEWFSGQSTTCSCSTRSCRRVRSLPSAAAAPTRSWHMRMRHKSPNPPRCSCLEPA